MDGAAGIWWFGRGSRGDDAMHVRGAVWCLAQGPKTGGGCARTWGGPTRRRARIARDGFESASTHEAVELPAGVAALHTALAKVD